MSSANNRQPSAAVKARPEYGLHNVTVSEREMYHICPSYHNIRLDVFVKENNDVDDIGGLLLCGTRKSVRLTYKEVEKLNEMRRLKNEKVYVCRKEATMNHQERQDWQRAQEAACTRYEAILAKQVEEAPETLEDDC